MTSKYDRQFGDLTQSHQSYWSCSIKHTWHDVAQKYSDIFTPSRIEVDLRSFGDDAISDLNVLIVLELCIDLDFDPNPGAWNGFIFLVYYRYFRRYGTVDNIDQ